MITLILVRHAKSSWKDAGLADRERPLNKRGKRDAPEMGERLASRKLKVDTIVSSPAKRALKTAREIAKKLDYPKDRIELDDRIYEAAPSELLQVVREWDDARKCVMMFGHNPGFTELANELGTEYIDNVPTCGVVELAFDVKSWKRVGKAKAAKMRFDYPKRVAE
jgi:phosphohistidine phosphatase